MTLRSTASRRVRAARTPALSLLFVGSLLAAGAVPAQSATGASPPAEHPAAPNAAAASETVVPASAEDISWSACEGAKAFECATIEVPSDYDEPRGATTEVAVTRLPATDQENRIGSVLVNFGGPGGPGVSGLHTYGEGLFDASVHERFDIVSFDPRAVGTSDPATCFPTAEAEQEFGAKALPLPFTRAQNARFLGEAAVLGATCTLFGGDRIATASTANVARDMDVLRQRLGDDKLTYVGYSYGTILGATYGKLFPENVRALVLDGTVDPRTWTGPAEGELFVARMRQAEAGTETYEEFLRLCVGAGERCALNALGDPAEVVEDVYAALKKEPVEVPAGDGTTVEVGYADLATVAFSSMYDTAYWPLLADYAAELAVLTGVAPAARADALDSGLSISELLRRLGLAEDYESTGGGLASLCVDADFPGRPASYPRKVAALDEQYPHFGLLRGWVGVHCEFISVQDEDAYTGPWEQATEEPVLVVGTRFDPATHYGFTAPYASLWPDARTLTVEGWGHTTINASTCADEAIGRYLISLEADDGAVCEQDRVPFSPEALRDDARPAVPAPRILTQP
ncbi:alpha/beta fold hydrolase [Promicromonospora iranensis]|uniref:Pimeloyl-ACP methyl ester carboxylesterase n=1 Tax=Promicromonospora iranensis TaxID=1105144 RepID=A0ABU2CVM0_9MICO|nr:alpha/beta fold hydrolase [Promicromonospora iranensis]MDR7385386.1 pimeloyl-ACP methyl ester carboxylesterase [Promicromonospora iranensis]